MLIRIVLVFLLSAVVVAGSPQASEDQAGTVVRLQGTAVAGDRGRPLAVGSPVHYGERIATKSNTRLRLRLIDGAVITLGDHSTFTIQGFAPEEQGTIFDLTNGVFLGISGALGGVDRPMTIKTNLGTVGIRGTTFWGRLDPGHLQVALIDGARVFVEASGRRYELTSEANGVDVYVPEREGPAVEQKKWGAGRIARSVAQVSFADDW